mgnify:CR=1 FL=1
MASFPKVDLVDWKALVLGEVINQLRNIFSRRIVIHQLQRLSKLLQVGNCRIRSVQNHSVIKAIVDPATHDFLNI